MLRQWLVTGSLALLLDLQGSMAIAQQPMQSEAPAPGPVVQASGYGEARVTPDRAFMSLGVETRAATAALASRENARLERAVIDTIRALGIPSSQIATESYSVEPEQIFNPQRGDQKPRITGYVVRNTVRVEVRKLEQVGALLDATIAKGANAVSSLLFFSSNMDEARRRALTEAVGRAQGDALALAQAAGRCLGEPLDLSTAQAVRPMMLGQMAVPERAALAPTPVQPGEQTVSATVTGRWRLAALTGGTCGR
jgi:uncharacterized protein YggE